MQLRLKTKFTLTAALLMLVVVALISGIYVARLTRQVIGQAGDRAKFVTEQVYAQIQQAIETAVAAGAFPASDTPEDLRVFVQQALEESAGLTSLIDAQVSYSPSIYEVSVVDQRGIVLFSSDPVMPGQPAFAWPPYTQLAQAGFVEQLRALYGTNVYSVNYPFNLGGQPFGEIRVALRTSLLRNEIAPGIETAGWLALILVVVFTGVAAVISHQQLAPLTRISAKLDRIARGEFDAVAPSDLHKVGALDEGELGQVSSKISRIGEQLRGVQEIFGTLRENIDQVMSGMEDGLIFFSQDARAVLVSPSVERFLGAPRETLLGRRVSEVFPPGHPVQLALGIEGDVLETVEGAEVHREVSEPGAVSRMNVTVQTVAERDGDPGAPMGALVTLRDLDSLERIGSRLETSERLSALGRVTAGVAHEVKNPLNSMSTWLGVLKQKMPAATDGDGQLAQQALTVLESEIHRLDRVVKTFLDFSRPVEAEFSPVPLGALLEEVAAMSRPQCQRAGVSLAVAGAQDPIAVRADRELLKQALLNLLLNAMEAITGVSRAGDAARAAAPHGQITLALDTHGDSAELRVSDNGPGIPPEKRDKVFQLFFTTRKGGSGIGLATVYRIVHIHGGSIDFETEVGRGTTFRIRLPHRDRLPAPPLIPASDEGKPVPVGALRHNGRTDG